MTTGNLLDVVATESMDARLYFRVHPTFHPAREGQVLSPLEPNPSSKARLAIVGDASHGVSPRAMFYVATSPAAALFETVFRNPHLNPGRQIVVRWDALAGMSLSTLRLDGSEQYVPLMTPDRGLVVKDPKKNAQWQWIVNTPNYAETHDAAHRVAAQFAATIGPDGKPLTLPAFGYQSVQCSSDRVFLHYAPPMQKAAWTVEHSVCLDTPDGYRSILDALTDAGFSALEDPFGDLTNEFAPPYVN